MTHDEIERIAKAAHTINRAYCQAIGDNTQPEWELVPDWQKDAIRNGVVFHVEHPDANMEAAHRNWCAYMEKDGWGWGPVISPRKMQHPCIVPYESISADWIAQYAMLRTIVNAMTQ